MLKNDFAPCFSAGSFFLPSKGESACDVKNDFNFCFARRPTGGEGSAVRSNRLATTASLRVKFKN